MCFFLVMWLINSTDKKTITQVATYFNPLRLNDRTASQKGLSDPAPHDAASEQSKGKEKEKESEKGSEKKNEERFFYGELNTALFHIYNGMLRFAGYTVLALVVGDDERTQLGRMREAFTGLDDQAKVFG